MDRDAAKQAAGEEAATFVEDGMTLGLGTGSTAAYALQAIGRRISEENLDVRGVPTSFGAERLAHRHGVPLTSLDDTATLDLGIDGADEVDPDLDLIKGGGAAHSREKVVATQAERFIVIVDPTKTVDRLGNSFALPIEVMPVAVTPITATLEDLGATADLREGDQKDGPVVTDQGLWVLDAHFPDGIADPHAVDEALSEHPGVLDHGLFLDLATDVLLGRPDGTVDHTTA
ncbi:MAG: ribose 5-phosphate isomerase A [Bacteroidetes bacterium SW_9_63_38]|nr:MAG: ribose 5-phosphate isomerase A [Bacteroidetes bacterium SW_9_63_38]